MQRNPCARDVPYTASAAVTVSAIEAAIADVDVQAALAPECAALAP
jgi:hypothetical protein